MGAIISITPDQAKSLNSYEYPTLIFSVTWADGSYSPTSNLIVFTPDDNFIDVAALIPANGSNPVCDDNAIWNMPVTVINFIGGGVSFVENNAQKAYKLFKQVQNQQEITFENKTPEEKAETIRNMFRNMPEDHPLRANLN